MRGLALLVALIAAVPDRPHRIGKDVKPLQEDLLGEWHVVSRIKGGLLENRDPQNWLFTRAEMQHINLRNGNREPASKFPYTLDATKNPAVIVFTAASYAGILKLEGDALTVCIQPTADKQPPPGFVSPANTQISLLQLTRVRR